MGIDDVELLNGTDCAIEKKSSLVDPVEEKGGIVAVQSCKDRCDEPAKNNTQSNNDSLLIQSCDCIDACFELGSCCPDYEPVCLETGIFLLFFYKHILLYKNIIHFQDQQLKKMRI